MSTVFTHEVFWVVQKLNLSLQKPVIVTDYTSAGLLM